MLPLQTITLLNFKVINSTNKIIYYIWKLVLLRGIGVGSLWNLSKPSELQKSNIDRIIIRCIILWFLLLRSWYMLINYGGCYVCSSCVDRIYLNGIIFAGINFPGFRGFSVNPRNLSTVLFVTRENFFPEILKTLTTRSNPHKTKKIDQKMPHPRKFMPVKIYAFKSIYLYL